MNNILVRTLSGAVFILLVLGSVLIHPAAMILCLGLFAALALFEFYNFFNRDENIAVSKPAGIIIGLSIFSGVALFLLDLFPIALLFLIIFIPVFGLFLSEIWRKKENPLLNLGVYASSYLYVVIPFIIMVFIA